LLYIHIEIAPKKQTAQIITEVITLNFICTEDEIESIFKQMQATHLLMARLIYASGIRLMECIRLRIHDVDFDMLEHGTNIRVLQELLGHADVKPTKTYTHVMRKVSISNVRGDHAEKRGSPSPSFIARLQLQNPKIAGKPLVFFFTQFCLLLRHYRPAGGRGDVMYIGTGIGKSAGFLQLIA